MCYVRSEFHKQLIVNALQGAEVALNDLVKCLLKLALREDITLKLFTKKEFMLGIPLCQYD